MTISKDEARRLLPHISAPGQRRVPVTISPNEIVGRLEALQSRLTDVNEHDDAFLIGLTIKAIRVLAGFDGENAPANF